jgi:hypothetical protein
MTTAKEVYDACSKWMAGDTTPAQALNLNIRTPRDAHRLMLKAYESLTPEERAQDYWSAMIELNKIPTDLESDIEPANDA